MTALAQRRTVGTRMLLGFLLAAALPLFILVTLRHRCNVAIVQRLTLESLANLAELKRARIEDTFMTHHHTRHLMGYEPETVIGTGIAAYSHEDDLHRIDQALATLSEYGATLRLEGRVRRDARVHRHPGAAARNRFRSDMIPRTT